MASDGGDLARLAAEAFGRVHGGNGEGTAVPVPPSIVEVDTGAVANGLAFGISVDPARPGRWTIAGASLPHAPAAIVATACSMAFPAPLRASTTIQHACAFIAWVDAAGFPWQAPFFSAWLAASGTGEHDPRYHMSMPVQVREFGRDIDLSPRELLSMLVNITSAGVPVDAAFLLSWIRFVTTTTRPLPGPDVTCVQVATCKEFVETGNFPQASAIRARCATWHPWAKPGTGLAGTRFTGAFKASALHHAVAYQVNFGLLGKSMALLAVTPGPALKRSADLRMLLDIPGMHVRTNHVQGTMLPAAGIKAMENSVYFSVLVIPKVALDAVKAIIKEMAACHVINKWTMHVARECTLATNWNAYIPARVPVLSAKGARRDPRLVVSKTIDYACGTADRDACIASLGARDRKAMGMFLDCMSSPFSHGDDLEHEATVQRVATFCGVQRVTTKAWIDEYVHGRGLLVPDPRTAMYMHPNAGFLSKVIFTGSTTKDVDWDGIRLAAPVTSRLECANEAGKATTVLIAGAPHDGVHDVISRVGVAWPGASIAIELTSTIFASRYVTLGYVPGGTSTSPVPVLAGYKDAMRAYASGGSDAATVAKVLLPLDALAGL